LLALKALALCLLNKVKVESAREKDIRFIEIKWQLWNKRDSGADRYKGDYIREL
jgi:hypothetical protein